MKKEGFQLNIFHDLNQFASFRDHWPVGKGKGPQSAKDGGKGNILIIKDINIFFDELKRNH